MRRSLGYIVLALSASIGLAILASVLASDPVAGIVAGIVILVGFVLVPWELAGIATERRRKSN
jgi:hypothetical protein